MWSVSWAMLQGQSQEVTLLWLLPSANIQQTTLTSLLPDSGTMFIKTMHNYVLVATIHHEPWAKDDALYYTKHDTQLPSLKNSIHSNRATGEQNCHSTQRSQQINFLEQKRASTAVTKTVEWENTLWNPNTRKLWKFQSTSWWTSVTFHIENGMQPSPTLVQ